MTDLKSKDEGVALAFVIKALDAELLNDLMGWKSG